ncbi:MAG: peptide chain release factor N(5)-glutamine methyltransferase [Pseudomonadales bacterium]|nr:peptide chain release factor N(5)-glutamine methyltransferase [Pseudomonadales bacterium]
MSTGTDPAHSVRSWLRAHRRLPRLDCELLLCHRLGLSRAQVMAAPERIIDAAALSTLESLAARLQEGEPLAYVLGEREFWGLSLRVTPDVLIPRPETETLVELALPLVNSGDRVLDLGTGSGAIAIALAKSLTLEVWASDVSPAALKVAADNAGRHNAPVTFFESDWFEQVPGRFHLIAANPPYVAADDPHLPGLRHEPKGALVSGAEGMDDLARIIGSADSFLHPGGWLLVEHGWNQKRPVTDCFLRQGYCEVATRQDLAGLDRVTFGRKAYPVTAGELRGSDET